MSTQPASQLSNISYWGNSLGLLPVNLSSVADDKFILLDGGIGDFCLQLKKGLEPEKYYHSAAWSSNTKNFVVYEGDSLKIFNWKKNKVEPVDKIELIEKQFSTFYDYLINSSFKSEYDVVPFIVNIFKQLRNLTGEKTDGVEALNLLFVLLTSLEEDTAQIDYAKWGLPETYIPAGFENYIQRFKEGVPGIEPKLDLILRHSAGTLFQEAHKEVVFFNRQLDFFSKTLTNDYELRRSMYSSIHYTPSYVARAIIENALRKADLTKATLNILDPACGSSEFLIEVLRQLKSLNYQGTIRMRGMDSSQSAINTSKFLLTYEKKDWNNLQVDLKLVKDSLEEDWGNDNDIILMNPPFQSWELMNKTERDLVMSTLGDFVTGRPNQASAFFYKATESLKNDGIIGCVIPSSLFTLVSCQSFNFG